jgi:hypothetical protein
MNYLQIATTSFIIQNAVDQIKMNQEFLARLNITNEKASEIGVGKIMNEICNAIFQQNLYTSKNGLYELFKHIIGNKNDINIRYDWNTYFSGNLVDDIIRRIFINFIISGTSPEHNITCTQLLEFVQNSAIQILTIFYNDDIKSVDEMHNLLTLYPTNPLIYVAYAIKSNPNYIIDHVNKTNDEDSMTGGSVNYKRKVHKNCKIRSISKRVRRTRRKQTRKAN